MAGDVVEVRLFGTFEVARGRRELSGTVNRKAQELLGLVLLAPQCIVRRETAAENLWPAASPEVSRKAIRQVLWQLHHATDERAAEPRLVEADGDVIRLNPRRGVWADVTAFAESARRACESSGGDVLSDQELREMACTAELHRGPLLAGCYDDWCLVHREKLDDLYITLLDRLSLAHERRGELEPAIRWGRALLDVEPAHERTHRRLMRLHYLADDRTRALRQYRRCRWILEQELGVRPSARTDSLAAAIEAETADRGAEAGAPYVETADALDTLRAQLEALRVSVDAIRDQIGRALA
jgi:DNA-binding SARP family transcriptional activator